MPGRQPAQTDKADQVSLSGIMPLALMLPGVNLVIELLKTHGKPTHQTLCVIMVCQCE